MSFFPVRRCSQITPLRNAHGETARRLSGFCQAAARPGPWLAGVLGLLCLMLPTAAQAPQTLTWNSPTNAALILGQTYPLAATASSGLPVTFRVQSGSALISAGTVTATDVGTVTLVAEQAGDATHAPASLARIFNQTEIRVSPLGAFPSPSGSETYAVQVEGQLAYVANRATGLQIINVSDPAKPVLVGSYSGTGGEIFNLQLVGHLAYVAAQDGLLILDVGNPASPVRVGGYPSGDFSIGVRVVGHVAYVADRRAGLLILDVTDPAQPKRLGSFALPGVANSVEIVGNLAYVADGLAGLQIVDVSDPAQPVQVGSFDTNSAVKGVQVVDQLAYVAAYDRGLVILDVSNPATPQRLGSYYNSSVREVQVVGRYAYAAAEYGHLQMLDVIDPSNPVLLQRPYGLGITSAVRVRDQVAYVGDFEKGLQLLGLRDGLEQSLDFRAPVRVLVTNAPVDLPLPITASSGLPVKLTVVDGPAQLSGSTLTFTNFGLVWVQAEQEGNRQFLPLSETHAIYGVRLDQTLLSPFFIEAILTNPVVVLPKVASSGLPVTYSLLYGSAVLEGNVVTGTHEGDVTLLAEQAGNSVYAPLKGGVSITFRGSRQLVTLLSPTNDVLALGRPYPLVATASTGWPVSFRVEVGPAVIVDGAVVATNLGPILIVAQQGVDERISKTVNVPTDSPLVGVWNPHSVARRVDAVQVVGTTAYAIGQGLGLQALNVSDPTNPTAVGNPAYFTATAFQITNHQGYLSTADGLFEVQNLDNSGMDPLMQKIGHSSRALQVADGLAYLANDSDGLVIYDLRQPGTVSLLGRYDASRGATDLQVDGHLVYLTDSNSGLLILNVADPKNPVLVAGFKTGGAPQAVQMSGKLAFVAASTAGLQIVDVSDPAHPVRAGSFQTMGIAVGLHVVGDRAYVAEGGAGVEVLDISNPAQPVSLASYGNNSSYVQKVQFNGQYTYLAAGDPGLYILDFGKPLQSRILVSTSAVSDSGLLLTPEVLGLGSARFQWFRGDQPLAGETNAYLHVAEVNSVTAGEYAVEIDTALRHGRSQPVIITSPPVVSTLGLPSLGTVKIHVETDVSQTAQPVRLEVSTDLQHWETITTGTGNFDFTLPASTGSTQFFRAVVE